MWTGAPYPENQEILESFVQTQNGKRVFNFLSF